MIKNFDIEDLLVDNEIHNEQVRLLAISIAEKIDDIESALRMMKQENTMLGVCVNDVRILADIIIKLTHDEIKKSQC